VPGAAAAAARQPDLRAAARACRLYDHVRDAAGAPVADPITGHPLLRWASRGGGTPDAPWLQCVPLRRVTGRAHLGPEPGGAGGQEPRFLAVPWFQRGVPYVLGDPL
jgi:hypothetical protein